MSDIIPTSAGQPVAGSNRSPKPMGRLPTVLSYIAIAAGGTGLFVLASAIFTPTMGAQRSTRLQWEQRQQEIEQTILQAEQAKP